MGRSAEQQAKLDRAVAAIDRELAANLELTSMFDQTKQAFVLENGQWHLHGATVLRELPAAHAFAADLYARLPDAESAMERRGPANSLKDEDREIVERWEGDAREAQRRLRADLARPAPSLIRRLIARLLGR
ncbi:MAG: hypothetical protein M3O64_01700 [Chloroflexota bacterium]|nr:hypothetical protein [Chloroflexota bacterium]